jgi:hypothetical protein
MERTSKIRIPLTPERDNSQQNLLFSLDHTDGDQQGHEVFNEEDEDPFTPSSSHVT